MRSNPLSTQDDVAAALCDYGIATYAIKGEDNATYYSHIESVIATHPQISMDDGCDLVTTIFTKHQDQLGEMIGGCEETTTGVIRLRAMQRDGVLPYPIDRREQRADQAHVRQSLRHRAIDARRHHSRDQRACWRAARSSWSATAGADAASPRGPPAWARTSIVTEVDPRKAIEAVMDGYRVMPMNDAAKIGDIFVTVTGNYHVIREEHFKLMKDGAIVCNSGHFNDELDLESIRRIARGKTEPRAFVEQYELHDGRKICILADGRLINLAAAEGHPAAVMDMSFSNQALATAYLVKHHQELEKNGSTTYRSRSTKRSRGSSSPRWASKSTRSRRSR